MSPLKCVGTRFMTAFNTHVNLIFSYQHCHSIRLSTGDLRKCFEFQENIAKIQFRYPLNHFLLPNKRIEIITHDLILGLKISTTFNSNWLGGIIIIVVNFVSLKIQAHCAI